MTTGGGDASHAWNQKTALFEETCRVPLILRDPRKIAPPLGGGTGGRALITDQQKYVVYGWGTHREQLFDLHADPGEMRNLVVESAFDPVLERMRHRLLDWCRRTNDTTFLKRRVLPADAGPEIHHEIFAIPY